jgi:Ras family protein T1
MSEGDVVVLLLGDKEVGKSSLITSFVALDTSPSPSKGMIRDQRIPSTLPGASHCILIIDSAHDEDLAQLRNKVRFADVIMFTHDLKDPTTLESISTKWLPLASSITDLSGKKLLVVGLRADLVNDPIALLSEEEGLLRLMRSQPLLLECLRCTINQHTTMSSIWSVEAVFRRAEEHHFYPVSPLFSAGSLTPRAHSAFKRIFRIFDRDGDGLWNDSELRAFHLVCFDLNLDEEALCQVRKRICAMAPFGVLGSDTTLDGLYTLVRMYIDSHPQNIWEVLWHCGYDEELDVDVPEDGLPPMSAGQMLRLSEEAVSFLRGLARYTCMAEEGTENALTPAVLSSIFSVVSAEALVPWRSLPVLQVSQSSLPCIRKHQPHTATTV